MIYVPDVSFYQYRYKADGTVEKFIDFQFMASKVPGVIIRAGQGTWEDKMFDASWEAAGKAGLARGTYWFYDPRVEPKVQARKWAEITRGRGEMEYWADFERLLVGGKEAHGYDNPHQWYDFMEEAKRLMPNVKFGVYTGYYYWRERFAGPIPLYWKQYPLWIASYGTVKPQLPAPWDTYLYWQFTDNGDGPAYGVASGNIDLNVFNGTASDFESRYQKPIQEKPMTTKYTMTGNTDFIRARSSVSTVDNTNVITTSPHYPRGTVFGGNEMIKNGNDMWMKVTEVNGQPVTERYVAYLFQTQQICIGLAEHDTGTTPVPVPSGDVSITLSLAEGKPVKLVINGETWIRA